MNNHKNQEMEMLLESAVCDKDETSVKGFKSHKLEVTGLNKIITKNKNNLHYCRIRGQTTKHQS